jgi:hypothetical protein
LRRPPRFGFGDRCTEHCNPVIAAAFVVELGIGPLGGFLNQPLLEHPLDRPVERAGA